MRHDVTHRGWESQPGKLRVLIECPPSSSPSLVAAAVERLGCEVRTCDGPAARGGCDLIDHGTCALVSGADVVVNMLAADDSSGLDVLDAVTSERRPPAAVVELTRPRMMEISRRERADLHRRATVVTTPLRMDGLRGGIRKALDQRERGWTPWWGDGAP